MKQTISKMLILLIIVFSQFNIYSQSEKLSGKYSLRHNIPKVAFVNSPDSTLEFPVYLHDEIIELKKSHKANITLIKTDKSKELLSGTWSQNVDKIEITLKNTKLTFRIVSIENKPHLKLENNEFKYYEKY